MSDINPNNDVGSNAVDVGGGGVVSFNDLMELDASQERAEEQQEQQEAAPAEKAASSEDTKTFNELENAKKVKEDKEIDTAPGAAAAKAMKLLKAKSGDAYLDIPADALMDAVIDGQKVPVSVQDLLNNYSGKVAYDKKFSDLDKQSKQTKAEREQLEDLVEGFFTRAKDPKMSFSDAIGYLAELSGEANPIEFVRQFRAKLTPDLDKWAQLPHQEREHLALKEENEYLSKRAQSESDRKTSETQRQIALEALTRTREAAGLSEESFKNTYLEIVKGGKVAEQDITPDYVVAYHKMNLAFDKAEDILVSIDPDLKANRQAVKELARIADDNPNFSEDDLKDIAQAMTGKKVKRIAKTLSDKVRKNEPKNAPAPTNSNTKESINFDEI